MLIEWRPNDIPLYAIEFVGYTNIIQFKNNILLTQ